MARHAFLAGRLRLLACAIGLMTLSHLAGCSTEKSTRPPDAEDLKLRHLQEGEEYRTPRAGEGFRTAVFGEDVAVLPRDRSNVSAWDLGAAAVIPGVTDSEVLPFASLYFWRHPDDETFFRAVAAGVYNEAFLAKSTEHLRPFEGVLTFTNFTVPFDQADYVDGERIEEEELVWGRVHGGAGIGIRTPVADPGANDNMSAITLLAEPGYLYFHEGQDAADDFVSPQDTFELRTHLMARRDAMERNLLELPHHGYAIGGDAVYGWRSNWEDWGRGAREEASDGRDYATVSGHIVGAGGVPFVRDDRHRLIGSFHGGTGGSLDRFSAFHVGGGPSPNGEEYEGQARPIIPGAFIEEFTTSHYAILLGEYRWEPIFFLYLSVRASAAYVDRERMRDGQVRNQGDFLGSVGARITTGFLFDTRLQIDYNWNAGVIRDGEFGGHEVVFHVSGQF
jgi:hypothetical protein